MVLHLSVTLLTGGHAWGAYVGGHAWAGGVAGGHVCVAGGMHGKGSMHGEGGGMRGMHAPLGQLLWDMVGQCTGGTAFWFQITFPLNK